MSAFGGKADIGRLAQSHCRKSGWHRKTLALGARYAHDTNER